jgi:flagellar biosynthesis protein FliR
MTNLKNVLSVGLAAATLVVFLTVTISGGALRAGLAPWPGIGAIVLATLAFVVSWKHRSFLVAGLLAASGVTGIIAGVINTRYFAVIVFPGPILGVIIGLGILALGVAKGIRTARTAEIPARS